MDTSFALLKVVYLTISIQNMERWLMQGVQHMESAYNATSGAMVLTYWNVGRRIVEQEQNGNQRTEYGTAIMECPCIGTDQGIRQKLFQKKSSIFS